MESSDKYSDFRDQLISWEEYEEKINQYRELIGINIEASYLIADLKKKLQFSAENTDDQFQIIKKLKWKTVNLLSSALKVGLLL